MGNYDVHSREDGRLDFLVEGQDTTGPPRKKVPQFKVTIKFGTIKKLFKLWRKK